MPQEFFVTTLRLPKDIMVRVSGMLEHLRGLPVMQGTRVARAAVLRLAILKGLEVLEQEIENSKKTVP